MDESILTRYDHSIELSTLELIHHGLVGFVRPSPDLADRGGLSSNGFDLPRQGRGSPISGENNSDVVGHAPFPSS